ncbi:hypothetical protein [Spirosoma endbachense]|uniref:Uncharacterized protein n=1 Tax=Spirosoma endbachense TaxID=2666025 RepID=A0A6P1W382_9BACT|nr:hypothetical protein [Spirosoma endbachense]QHV99008.1 hypothetical protein GJR95_30150 [Spirosoma endbachense]
MKHTLFIMLLFPIRSLSQPKYIPLVRFDTLIYQYTISIQSGQRVDFPAGCHLYDITHQSRTGGIKVLFRDGSALYQKAVNSAFYIARTHNQPTGSLVPLKYGDRNWQSSESAGAIQSVTALDKAHFQLTYFTLTPLPRSPILSSYP